MIETERLILRRWKDSDIAPFSAINADPRVMEFYPKPLSAEESRDFAARIETHFEKRGFGLWALELKSSGAFIGYTGCKIFDQPVSFAPCTEIGWRVASDHWGQGYAPEAARAALAEAFRAQKPGAIYAFTATSNLKSQRVMEKIGMERAASLDFEHPALPPGHPLRPHIVYRITG